MKDLKLFASASGDHALRTSGIGGVAVCPWRSVLAYLGEAGRDEAGEAADTGSATHVAVREFHRGKTVAECIRTMSDERGKYPLFGEVLSLPELSALCGLAPVTLRNRLHRGMTVAQAIRALRPSGHE